MNPQRLSSSAPGSRAVDRVAGLRGRRQDSASAAERDALYRHNEQVRLHPVPVGAVDAQTPVSVLGLEQATISRLYRAGIIRLQALLGCSVEELWRSIGRHGISDILDRLEANGLALKPLTDYEKWRLGRVEREAIDLQLAFDTRVADLWPRLGPTLTDVLRKRGMLLVTDLVAEDEESLLLLYRLGKANLRRIETLLQELAHTLEGAPRRRVEHAIERMAAFIHGRHAARSFRTRTVRFLDEWDPSPGGCEK